MLGTLQNLLDHPLDLFVHEFDRTLCGPSAANTFPVDIHEDKDGIKLQAELPGFNKSEIDITTENGVLTILADHTAAKAEKSEGKVHLNERIYCKLMRSFFFPDTVDLNKIEASLTNGVLTLHLPKREQVKPHRIKVH